MRKHKKTIIESLQIDQETASITLQRRYAVGFITTFCCRCKIVEKASRIAHTTQSIEQIVDS
jgi:hypothetical protein